MRLDRIDLTCCRLALLAVLAAGCSRPGAPAADTSASEASAAIALWSPAFEDGAAIPERYTCRGAGFMPPLRWGRPPEGSRSLVLMLERVGGEGAGELLWAAYDLPAAEGGLDEEPRALGADEPEKGYRSANRFGAATYDGPCPAAAERGTYRFRLYAVGYALGGPFATVGEVYHAVQGAGWLGEGRLLGTFGYGAETARER